jgi:hypothetical protein
VGLIKDNNSIEIGFSPFSKTVGYAPDLAKNRRVEGLERN